LLFEVLSETILEESRPPLLIACNKSDVKGATKPKKLRASIEHELGNIRKSRFGMAQDGASEG